MQTHTHTVWDLQWSLWYWELIEGCSRQRAGGQENCIFRTYCGAGWGMRCFSPSRRHEGQSCDVGWMSGTVHSEIKRQQSEAGWRWTCLCFASLHPAETMCSAQKWEATTTGVQHEQLSQEKTLFCVKMATIYSLITANHRCHSLLQSGFFSLWNLTKRSKVGLFQQKLL